MTFLFSYTFSYIKQKSENIKPTNSLTYYTGYTHLVSTTGPDATIILVVSGRLRLDSQGELVLVSGNINANTSEQKAGGF